MSPASRQPVATARPRWMRWLVVAVGVTLATVMLWLGLWQMQVFRDQGQRSAEHRVQEAPVSLVERIPAGGAVGDVYGRTVDVGGTFVPSLQVAVQSRSGDVRRLVGFRLADGRLLPVVVGTGSSPAALPVGTTVLRGVFMPAEAEGDWQVPTGSLPSVRLQLLAQRWDGTLTPGFLTLDEAHARALGMRPATVTLPQGDGAVRNGGYALQWWVFAGFALAGSIALSRSMRPTEDVVADDHDR